MNTPTPWVVRVNDDHYSDKDDVEICGNPDGRIGGTRVLGNFWHTHASAVDNANFVVRAVNAHQALVETLEDLLCLHNNGNEILDSDFDQARAALKLARGES